MSVVCEWGVLVGCVSGLWGWGGVGWGWGLSHYIADYALFAVAF